MSVPMPTPVPTFEVGEEVVYLHDGIHRNEWLKGKVLWKSPKGWYLIDNGMYRVSVTPRNIKKMDKGIANMVETAEGERKMSRQGCPKGKNVGLDNGRALLTPEKVIEIRRLRQKGMKYADIAAKFGVSTANIVLITQRKTWKQVQDPLGA